jgi:outer membrane protein OmpA-like peptidoglycan-associated protein
MKKMSTTFVLLWPGTAILFFVFLLSGCGEIRYEDNVKKYNSSQPGVTTVSGQYEDATARYISRDGYASTPKSEVIIAPPEKQTADLAMVIEVTDVLFEFDKWVIKKPFIPELKQWADYFKNNPEVKASIYGHTDSTGPTTYNEKLSMKRAQAVVDFLVGAGVSSGRLTARGFGEIQPTASNATKEGRQKNRRVELEL